MEESPAMNSTNTKAIRKPRVALVWSEDIGANLGKTGRDEGQMAL